MFMDNLVGKDKIIEKLENEFGKERVFVVSTKDYDLTKNPMNKNKSRSSWADEVCKTIYNKERKEIIKSSIGKSKGEYNFSYIKLAIKSTEKGNEIIGIVGGKSSFHCNYASDVWFYNNKRSKKVLEFMEENNCEWFTESIIIVKNINSLDACEAEKNEKDMKELFHLFD